MFAVIELGGHQYIVKKGDVIQTEKVKNAKSGADFVIDKVLLTEGEEGQVTVGKPYISGVSVVAQHLGDIRGKKQIVFRYRPKKRYRKKKGHRQTYSKIKIVDIKAF